MYIHSNVSISDNYTQHPDARIDILHAILITKRRTSSRKRQKTAIHIQWTRDEVCEVIFPLLRWRLSAVLFYAILLATRLISIICPGARCYSCVFWSAVSSLYLHVFEPIAQCALSPLFALCDVVMVSIGSETFLSSIHSHTVLSLNHLSVLLCSGDFGSDFYV